MFSVVRLERNLLATVQSDLSDELWGELQAELILRVGTDRARTVIVDVTKMALIDSYAGRALGELTEALRLRGARTIVVGIQPAVAFSMVRLGLSLQGVETQLDLDRALAAMAGRDDA